MNIPELYIIAGPNGAGKSTLSATIVPPGTFIFDGDKELKNLQKRFPGIDDAVLWESVNGQIFTDQKTEAISNRKNFAIETNFANGDLMKTVKEFQECGYRINLIYFGLGSVNQAQERVNLRVKKGGHYVSREDIKTNYTEGLKNISTFYASFDHAIILHNSIHSGKNPRLVNFISFHKGKVIRQQTTIPSWAKKIVEELAEENKPRQSIPHRKPRR